MGKPQKGRKNRLGRSERERGGERKRSTKGEKDLGKEGRLEDMALWGKGRKRRRTSLSNGREALWGNLLVFGGWRFGG